MDSISSLRKSKPELKRTIRALRLDDVGAATKVNEIYGRTRLPVGPLHIPFPGNFLFLKRMPGIRKWGPYQEMTVSLWDELLEFFRACGLKLTVGVTATWVEKDGRLTPFSVKFPAEARRLRTAQNEGLIEIANHGLTHCVLDGRRYLPRWFSSNRSAHREFFDYIPEEVQRHHLERSQAILQDIFGPVTTLIPPGNVFTPTTVEIARSLNFRAISCKTTSRVERGIAFVGDSDILPFHDREVVLYGVSWLREALKAVKLVECRLIREVADEMLAGTIANV